MIEVLFIQIPAGANRDKMFVGLRSVVSKECYVEALGYGNKEVALRRLLGEALVRFALKKCWNLTSEDYRIDRGEKGKPFFQGITLFVPCLIERSVLILKNGQKLVWRLRDVFFTGKRWHN